jgi:hypothetical protein
MMCCHWTCMMSCIFVQISIPTWTIKKYIILTLIYFDDNNILSKFVWTVLDHHFEKMTWWPLNHLLANVMKKSPTVRLSSPGPSQENNLAASKLSFRNHLEKMTWRLLDCLFATILKNGPSGHEIINPKALPKKTTWWSLDCPFVTITRKLSSGHQIVLSLTSRENNLVVAKLSFHYHRKKMIWRPPNCAPTIIMRKWFSNC